VGLVLTAELIAYVVVFHTPIVLILTIVALIGLLVVV